LPSAGFSSRFPVSGRVKNRLSVSCCSRERRGRSTWGPMRLLSWWVQQSRECPSDHPSKEGIGDLGLRGKELWKETKEVRELLVLTRGKGTLERSR